MLTPSALRSLFLARVSRATDDETLCEIRMAATAKLRGQAREDVEEAVQARAVALIKGEAAPGYSTVMP